MSGRVWVDVEDLLSYARKFARPSGIQRLAFEIFQQLAETADARFVRHPAPPHLAEVGWGEVLAAFAEMSGAASSAPAPAPAAVSADAGQRGALRRVAFRFPPSVQHPLMRGLRAQRDAAKAFGEAALAGGKLGAGHLRGRRGARAAGPDALDQIRPGDLFLVLDSPYVPHYEVLLAAVRARGARVGILVYDMIPVVHPEWCDAGLVRTFRHWMAACLPLADRVFAISRTTARDTEAFAAAAGFTLAGPVVTLPIGTGFCRAPGAAPPRGDMPAPGSYVLFVSTIEPRKNHQLLFRVWWELSRALPRERIPTLVFAGRVGWMTGDLLRQLTNADWLGGLIRHVEAPNDAELAALYDGALFTIFPSLYEGWGLPVTESFAHGKPCLVARTASLPEAGGTLARYFDPDNLHDTIAAVRTLIDDRAGLAAWEAEVRSRFQPVSWRETALALLRSMENPASQP